MDEQVNIPALSIIKPLIDAFWISKRSMVWTSRASGEGEASAEPT